MLRRTALDVIPLSGLIPFCALECDNTLPCGGLLVEGAVEVVLVALACVLDLPDLADDPVQHRRHRGAEEIVAPVVVDRALRDLDARVERRDHAGHRRDEADDPHDDRAQVEPVVVVVRPFGRARVELSHFDVLPADDVVVHQHDAGEWAEEHGEAGCGRDEDAGRVVEEPRLHGPGKGGADEGPAADVDEFREQACHVHARGVAVAQDVLGEL